MLTGGDVLTFHGGKMAQDDLVPDEALVARLDEVASALMGLTEIASLRSHLPADKLHDMALMAASLVGEMNAAAQPDDEINAKYRSRMRDEYGITASGRRFYIYDPRADEVAHHDIVSGLTHECRYAGQIPRFYSVAEHSIKVAVIAEHLATEAVARGEFPEDMLPLVSLVAMLHDAHEAYCGDIPHPYKARLADVFGTPWERIEGRVQECVHEAYALPPLPVEVEGFVQQADAWMLYVEVLAFHPNSADQFPSLKKMRLPPPEVVELARVKSAEPDRGTVRSLFDQEVRRLVSLVGGQIPGDRIDERRVERQDAVAQFAEAMKQAGIPGDRPNPPPPPTDQPIETPTLTREPRGTDVKPGEWKQAVRSSSVEPGANLSRLLSDPDLTPEERARLAEMGGGQ